MAQPLYYPSVHHFYPTGNTPASSLLRDLAPEESANILLLGCGDPRHILYSIFCEGPSLKRALDFTCCDIDPAVLARNVILLTMVADNRIDSDAIWSIFFHIYIDQESRAQLISHCHRLLNSGASLEEWRNSYYGAFLRFSSEHTLSELRRHWQLYINMEHIPAARLAIIQQGFAKVARRAEEYQSGALLGAGIFADAARDISRRQARAFWASGTAFQVPGRKATYINPTFAYSLAGEGFHVHYATNPLTPFHFSHLFAPGTSSVGVDDLVAAGRGQFSEWCSNFRMSIRPGAYHTPKIRFAACDAFVLCRSLSDRERLGSPNIDVPVADWTAQTVQLDRVEYKDAPSKFRVIDTSNLSDHVGLLNLLSAASPLLQGSLDGVLYTESLRSPVDEHDQELAAHLYGDVHTVGFLLGLLPVDHMSAFSSRSNADLLLRKAGALRQFQFMTTWKACGLTDGRPPTWSATQLASCFYGIFRHIFQREDPVHLTSLTSAARSKVLDTMQIVHHTRESFVLLLRTIWFRFKFPPETWNKVIETFLDAIRSGPPIALEMQHYNEVLTQLYVKGLYTDTILDQTRTTGIFREWAHVPLIVRVLLVVPRAKFDAMTTLAHGGAPPVLQCYARGDAITSNTFTAVRAVYGTVVGEGTNRRPQIRIVEDPKGPLGSSPVVVSFAMPAGLFTLDIDRVTKICLAVRITPATIFAFNGKFGEYQVIFTGNVSNTNHVHVLPYPEVQSVVSSSTNAARGAILELGEPDAVTVELNAGCTQIERFVSVVRVQNPAAKALFSDRSTQAQVSQPSACVVRLAIGPHSQEVVFPAPILPQTHKLENRLRPWNLHHVPLSQLRPLSATRELLHLAILLAPSSSAREHTMAPQDDVVLGLKSLINSMVLQSWTHATSLLFRLCEQESMNCDTVICIRGLKWDPFGNTIVCDAFVIPLTHELFEGVEGAAFMKALQLPTALDLSITNAQQLAWKALMPALVERCRTWTHGPNCEYRSRGRVPLTLEMDQDPLCRCGRGQDVEGMREVPHWAPFAAYAVRIALSPLFAVASAEKIGPEMCASCQGAGKRKLLHCSRCRTAAYCSKECQTKDWATHKQTCCK
ncbi:MYND-type domain-containing protein [Mycena chlorophos]|uniref:MYND-type domain-containing protein n=1 Tax=Mycena chlorophos TaxID=658473 RepID=A0A8H6WD23_MYCCL|nr:MYND-type domain-containing protein [Mycena chlorophos]